MIETSQLHTLVSVAQAQSFSKAAEHLKVTQSAISQSIKNLENRIGVKLFSRSGKKMVLTVEGEKIYRLGAEFLLQMDEIIDEVQHDKDSMSGQIRIGALMGMGKSWLCDEMLRLAQKFDSIKIQIKLGFEEYLIAQFKDRKLDIVILPEASIPHGAAKVFIGEEKLTLVYPRQKNYSVKMNNADKTVLKEVLSNLPTILFEKHDFLYTKWFRECFGDAPVRTNIRFIVNSHSKMLEAVQTGVGVAVLPTHVVKHSYLKDKICILGSKYEISSGKFYLCYHKDAEDILRIRKTIDLLSGSKNPLSV